MDNSSVIGSIIEAGDVLVNGAEMISGTGKSQNTMETKRGHTLAYNAALGVSSDMLVSPTGDDKKELVTLYHPAPETAVEYTTSKSGRVICTFIDDTKDIGEEGRTIVPDTMQFTRFQVFMAIKVAVATGLPANQSTAWFKHQAGEVIPPHLAHEVSPASKKVGARMSTWKQTYMSREHETIMDMLQDAEDTRAELAGDITKAKNVRKAAKEKASADKRAKEDNDKPARDVAGEYAINAIRRLNKDESPDDYDHAGAIAAFRSALVCLNVEDATLDAHDDDNK